MHLNCCVSTSSFPKRGLLLTLPFFRFWSGSQDHITCGKRKRCCSYLHLAEKFCYRPRFKMPWILFHLCFVSDCSFFPLPYQTNTVCFPLSQKLILLIVKKHKSLELGETIDIPFLILIQDLTNYFLLPGWYGLTF